MTQGQRGKTAEGKVKDLLVQRALRTNFAWYRPPDARAGSFLPTTCDFFAMHNGKLHLLEVKEVDHEYRLPHKNLEAAQVGRMLTWVHAGAEAWILVHHTKNRNTWRYFPLHSLPARTGGSWDFSELQTYDTASFILREIFDANDSQ